MTLSRASCLLVRSTGRSFSTFRPEGEGWILPAVVGGAVIGTILLSDVQASENKVHPPHQAWYHNGFLSSFDAAGIRRGYEVYRQICSTCHSMKYLYFRNLVGVSHTEEQAKALAASYKIKDGPNDQGEFYERPGRLNDHFPQPYENEEQARSANGGALPPDLSLIVKAREGGEDYIFSLLTGYQDPPVGVTLRPGLHYNPYFGGGAISMAKPLQDGGIEFEDGIPATVSQQAKDVVTFLSWAAEPKHDERKKLALKIFPTLLLCVLGTAYWKRFRWNIFKTRRIRYVETP